MTIFEALKSAEKKLSDLENGQFDAKMLLLFAFDITNEQYSMKKNEPCDTTRLAFFDELCKRRLAREPLQYIIGNWNFYGLDFKVEKGCLIPRPETEIIVQTALSLNIKDCRFIDLCSGSGCIGISYAENNISSSGILFDVSDDALEISNENIIRYNLQNRVKSKKFDIFIDTIPHDTDILMSNPPYINKNDMQKLDKELEFEPQIALYGGDDGLDFYRAICQRQITCLKQGAYIILEIGYDQSESVCELLKDNNCRVLDVIKDLSQIDRTILAKKE